MHHHRVVLGLAMITVTAAGIAGCTDTPADAADRMRTAYAPTQRVTVGSFSWEIAVALRDDVVYGVGSNRLVQIDRASGTVLELMSPYPERALSSLIAADDSHVYVELQGVGLQRVPKGGGAAETLREAGGDLSISAMQVHGGVVYVAGTLRDRAVLLAIPTTGGPEVELAELAPASLSAFTVTADGIFVGNASTGGAVSRIPLAGGAPEVLQQSPEIAYHLEGDATGVYWNLAIGEPAPTTPARLFTLPAGSTEPQELAGTATRGSFDLNDLGFYWVDHDARAIVAIAREDLAGAPFELFATGDAPSDVVVDDHAIVYTTDDDDDDLGDLELHVVPRVH